MITLGALGEGRRFDFLRFLDDRFLGAFRVTVLRFLLDAFFLTFTRFRVTVFIRFRNEP